MRLVMVCRDLNKLTNYVRLLREGLKEAKADVDTLYYLQKNLGESSLPEAKGVWSPYFYPFQITRQALKDKPDLIHVQFELITFGSSFSTMLLPFLLLFMKLSRIKVLVTIHCVISLDEIDKKFVKEIFGANVPCSFMKFALVCLYSCVYKLSDSIIVHTATAKKDLSRFYKIRSNNIFQIPYGIINNTSVDSQQMSLWSNRLEGRTSILYFGTVSPRKDLMVLIKSFAQARKETDCLLIIAGITPPFYKQYELSLKESVKELAIADSVLFTGTLKDNEIDVLYKLSAFVILPYKILLGGASGPLSFAIQNAKALITTDKELKNDVEAIVVQPGNIDELVVAINKLLSDDILRKNLALNLALRKENRTWQKVGLRTFEIYKRLYCRD